MSHQTGIKPSSELEKSIAQAKKGNQRVLKIIIKDEQLQLADQKDVKGTWEKDFDAFVHPMLEQKAACYIFYRLDTKDAEGYGWLFVTYIPDFSPVREKMLYASTKATMKSSFGGTSHINEEYTASTKAEISLDGYNKHLVHKAAPGPLTEAEVEHKMVLEMETRSDIGVDTKSQTLPGLSFPMEPDALARVKELKDYKNTYVQLSIDLKKETISLESHDPTNISQLPSRIPDDSPRYHLFIFPHTYEGDVLNSIVFIYTMPGYKCSVKERMLYSSCKGPLVFALEQLGITFGAKIELQDRHELTDDFLTSEIHPIRIVHKPKFDKPKGPAGRKGQSRVTGSRGNTSK